jgi:hypothetical protein
MPAEAWILLGIFISGGIIWLFKLLLRIDRRLFSLATNHLPHVYDRLMELDGKPIPTLEDMK